MKVIFCNIAWMEYYSGVRDSDQPEGGGKWIKEKIHLEECHNFDFHEDKSYHGYIYTKESKSKNSELKIENIKGVAESDEQANEVTVIWVAKDPFQNKTNIIGWYKNAIVYRNCKFDENQNKYNVVAKSEDCVLLPINKRHKIVPKVGKNGYSYGMTQANIWYGKSEDKNSQIYIKNMMEYINKYNDDNLLLSNNY